MNVKQLKAYLATVPDDAELVVSAHDHSYRPARATATTGLFSRKYRTWSEDFGEEDTPETKDEKRLPVLLIE